MISCGSMTWPLPYYIIKPASTVPVMTFRYYYMLYILYLSLSPTDASYRKITKQLHTCLNPFMWSVLNVDLFTKGSI